MNSLFLLLFRERDVMDINDSHDLFVIFLFGFMSIVTCGPLLAYGFKLDIFVMFLIFFGVFIVYLLSLIGNMKSARIKRELKEQELLEQKMKLEEIENKREKFIKRQTEKGLVEYNNKWMTPKERDKLKRKERKIRYSSYTGKTMECSSCKYVWTIKKQIGLPAKCPRCGSDWIRLIDSDKKK